MILKKENEDVDPSENHGPEEFKELENNNLEQSENMEIPEENVPTAETANKNQNIDEDKEKQKEEPQDQVNAGAKVPEPVS